MSTYIETIEKHVIFSELENVKNELLIIIETPDIPPADAEALARISLIIENFSVALDTCDKNLIVVSWLNDAKNNLTNIKSYLTNYKSTKNASYITSNASSQLDSLLQCSVKLNCVRSNKSYRVLTKSIEEYAKVLSANTEQSHLKIQELNAEIENLKKQITTFEKTAEKNATDFQITIDAEKKRLDGFATSYQQQMNSDQNDFITMLNESKETFKLSQEGRNKTFDTEVAHLQALGTDFIKLDEERYETLKMNSEQLISNYEKKFSDYEEKVKLIVGKINTNVFSYKYKEVADDAKKRSIFWHVLTVILMILVGGFAIYALIITINDNTNWTTLVAKIFTTTTLVTSAAYAARQASKQEKVERYARQVEMELVAIDPFIASLEPEKQSALKEELTKKLFGNTNVMEMSSKDEPYVPLDNLTAANELIKSISDFAAKLNK